MSTLDVALRFAAICADAGHKTMRTSAHDVEVGVDGDGDCPRRPRGVEEDDAWLQLRLNCLQREVFTLGLKLTVNI